MGTNFFLLIALGLGIGTLGTLIGAGGGFILVPVLILFYPKLSPEIITAISLAVVAANATVGSSAYIRSQKVDFKTGIIFAIATIPGSIIGVLATNYIPRHRFDLMFGILLLALAIYLFFKGGKGKNYKESLQDIKPDWTFRRLTDKEGHTYEYSYNLKVGIIISVLVGFFSPLLGIGGGVIHVPAMIQILHFPVHIATATSHFILAIMSLVSVIVHAFQGHYDNPEVLKMIGALIIGIFPGAILGANISKRVKGTFIIKALSIALVVVAIRILISVF